MTSRIRMTAAIAALGLSASVTGAHAATDTATFNVTITIQDSCDANLTAPTTMAFGTNGVLSANVDQTSTITVTCTSGTAYNIGLDAGANESTPDDTDTRRMKDSGSNYVSYQLYQPAGYSTAWGDQIGSDTVSASGSGSAQAYTVNGRVPPQTTPPAGSYSDTIQVTVTY